MTIRTYDGRKTPDMCEPKKVMIYNREGGLSHLYTSSEWMILFATVYRIEGEKVGLFGAVKIDYLYKAYNDWCMEKL